jgi:hypothetical protein
MNKKHFIVICDDVNEDHIEKIEKVCTECILQDVDIFLYNVNKTKYNDDELYDILVKNDKLLSYMIDNRLDIIKDRENEYIKNCLSLFYFSKMKSKIITENIEYLYKSNKFILYQNIEKYKALINVLKKLVEEKSNIKNDKFYDYYNKLEGSDEVNELYHEFYGNIGNKRKEESNENSENKEIVKKLKKDVNYNIKIKKSKNIDPIMKIGHILYTYYIVTNDEMTNNIQLQCIMENYKNTLFTKICIYVDSEDIQKNIYEKFNIELGNDCNEKIRYILNKNSSSQLFNMKNVFEDSNSNYVGDIIYITRSDIVIPNQDGLKNIEYEFIGNKRIYSISRIERRLDGQMFKDIKYNKYLHGSTIDMFIYQSSFMYSKEDTLFNEIDFYKKGDELKINKIFEYYGYDLFNDTINCKILRILRDQNVDIRHILKNSKEWDEDIENKYQYSIVPENSTLNSISLSKLINEIQLSDDDEYLIKKYIFNYFSIKK